MSEYDNYLGSITVRMPIPLQKELDSKSGKHKSFRDRSDAIRELTKLGLKVHALQQAYKDPKKQEEIKKKLSSLMDLKEIEKKMESWNEEELSGIIFVAENLKDKKVEQVLLDIK